MVLSIYLMLVNLDFQRRTYHYTKGRLLPCYQWPHKRPHKLIVKKVLFYFLLSNSIVLNINELKWYNNA